MNDFWNRVADLPGFSPVVDYQPAETAWARYLTTLHVRALDEMVALQPTDRFLDFGCGIGRITAWLAAHVAHVVGVDSSPRMIEVARERYPLPNVEFHLLAADLPLHDFDGITAIWVLQHILEEALFEETLELFARAVRPGGSVYCLDRLCRDEVDRGESSYLKLRSRTRYEVAFQRRGLQTAAHYPISVNEHVLGRPNLTKLAQRRTWTHGLLSRLDLAWARRQADPFLADELWHFTRRA